MPVKIIEKPAAKPQCVNYHPPLVALRVAEILAANCNNDARREHMAETVAVGNVCVLMPGDLHAIGLFNATTGNMVNREYLEYITFIRAYDIAQIIITNDELPAPAQVKHADDETGTPAKPARRGMRGTSKTVP